MSFIKDNKNNIGFTIAEITIAMGVFFLLAAVTFISINPAKRLGKGNDAQRWEDLTAIAKAVELYQIDNDALPSDFSSANINTGHKVVLCSSAATLTCDGQTRDCLVVNDTDFLGTYIDSLPVDPTKTSDADTGYYITRTGDMMTFGACSSYDNDGITRVVKASLATYSATCGDGVVEGAEVCDDGNLIGEGCGNGILESAGTYCNANCTLESTIADEWCDSNLATSCYDNLTLDWYYSDGYVNNLTYCNKSTTACNDACNACVNICS